MINLRPKTIQDIIGQDHIKECVKILIQSRRNDVLPHMGFFGPPGTGKTTFAQIIAHENKSKIYLANGGNITKAKDVLPYLTRLKRGDILFIDEVHRVSKKVQEQLYTVMEDFRYDMSKGACSINLEPFTLIGATTESGLLLRPFYDRLEHHFQLQQYSVEEISLIIQNNVAKMKYNVTNNAVKKLAKMSKFTPRIANSLLRWCCDYIKAKNVHTIDDTIIREAMLLKQIDNNGLNSADRKYINVLKRANKPLGLNTVAAMTGFSVNVIEHSIEPYLCKLGLIEKTTKGRKLM